MVRHDVKQWAKLCYEATDFGTHAAVSVVTRCEHSDDANGVNLDAPDLWLQVFRLGDVFGMHYALDGSDWRMVRLFRLAVSQTVKVGLEPQCPSGPGTTIDFLSFTVEPRTVTNLRLGQIIYDTGASMIYELRTYWAAPGKAEALHNRFRTLTLGIFAKHAMQVVGFWTPDPSVRMPAIWCTSWLSPIRRRRAAPGTRSAPIRNGSRGGRPASGMGRCGDPGQECHAAAHRLFAAELGSRSSAEPSSRSVRLRACTFRLYSPRGQIAFDSWQLRAVFGIMPL